MRNGKGRWVGRTAWSVVLLTAVFFLAFLPVNASKPQPAAQAKAAPVLSPLWEPSIQQWSDYIGFVADANGLDPDFIAAVIHEASNGDPDSISPTGTVGLMGVTPVSSNLDWRPSKEELQNPSLNLRWGATLLAEMMRQSGGDLYSALAAYNSGWSEVSGASPRHYAANVLDSYGRAVMARNGLSPDIASQWTIAVRITKGNVPLEPLLILGDQPVSGLYTYGEHTIYNSIDEFGRPYYIHGYVVPISLVVSQEALSEGEAGSSGNEVDVYLQSRLSQNGVKVANNNPRLLQACLPSLSRLRGLASTRWFAPTDCPANNR